MTTGSTSSSSAAPGRARGRSSPSGSPARSRRAIGLAVPDLVGIEVDASLGDAEPDEEIHDLVRASGGLNLGMDFLPGALAFNPAAAASGPPIDPAMAADTVWLDALVTNPDRTARNPNLLVWHGRLWLIDHGAALYIHHTWRDPDEHARRPFERIRDHVLLPFAGSIAEADERHAARIDEPLLDRSRRRPARTRGCLPDASIGDERDQRAAYVRYLLRRLEAPRTVCRGGRACPPSGIASSSTRSSGSSPGSSAASASTSGWCCCAARSGSSARGSHLDEARLAALAPDLDPELIRPHLAAIERIAAGDPAAGPIARLGKAERFHWLVAPASTMIQPSEVHSGLCDDPAAELDRLVATLVD